MERTRTEELAALLRQEVKPALGCTEPVAVALATAKAVEIIAQHCCRQPEERLRTDFEIEVSVSGNILKNGMGVGVPGTGMVGLPIAAALGAVCGRSSYGLEVLHDLEERAIARAKELTAGGRVRIVRADTDKKLYVRAVVRTAAGHCASATITDIHDRIVRTTFDTEVLTEAGKEDGGGESPQRDHGLSVREIYDFCTTADPGIFRFLLEEKRVNLALAEEGLAGNYGIGVGRSIRRHGEIYGNDFLSYAVQLTAAAADARMAGCTLPAFSNSGSGNQGLIVSLPVIACALHYGATEEQLVRALALSNLIAIHIKSHLGRLSAICGAVIASIGAACGLVLLRGGDCAALCAAIKNMVGDLAGMVCDGAKAGCAFKVASGVESAVRAAVLALDGRCISDNDGIVEKDIEKTVRNLASLGSKGMQQADDLILDIMVCK